MNFMNFKVLKQKYDSWVFFRALTKAIEEEIEKGKALDEFDRQLPKTVRISVKSNAALMLGGK